MSLYSELPIYNNLFFLLKEFYTRIPKFAKQYKYFLGEKILAGVSESILLVHKISEDKDMQRRYEYAEMIETNMTELLLNIRIAQELNQFTNSKSYFFLFEKIANILDQAKKWKKYFKKNSSQNR